MNHVSVALGASVLMFAGNTTAAVLSGTFIPRSPGSNVHLSTAGAFDWVHWGLAGTNANRKIGVTPVISSYTQVGENIPQQTTNAVEFSWTGGTPVSIATNVVTSIAIGGLTNGFAFDLPVPTASRKLKVYVGAVGARGRLEATLPGAASFVDEMLGGVDPTNGVYILDFTGNSSGDRLQVKYTVAEMYDPGGYITLQAAAYSTNSPPFVAVSHPVSDGNVVVGEPTMITVSAVDSDGAIAKVEFFIAGTTKIGESTNAPFTIAWTATNLGPHTLTARATDNNGGQAVSTPISFFVTDTTGQLASAFAAPPGNVHLTTEGTTDWVHWGLFTSSSVNRKAGVIPQLGNLTIIGLEPAYHYADNPTTYSWTDGTPNSSVANTPTGVFVAGLSNGFSLTIPADSHPRTLRVYVGAYGARAKMTGYLSDYSSPVFVDRSVENVGNGPAAVYSFYYRSATDGETLTLNFTCDKKHDIQYANVTFQAATLVSAVDPFSISLVAPTNNAVFDAPANVPLVASVAGSETPRKVEFYNGATKLGQDTSPPYTFAWNNVPPGVYDLTARTTNDIGITLVSAPIQVFVITGGGYLLGTFAPGSGSANLTSEGTLDWVHWGLVRQNSVTRKRDVPQRISDVTEVGKGRSDRYADNGVSFSWSDGSPATSVDGTTTGIFKYGLGSGFQITVPATTTVRRLKVFVGVFAATAEFQASLSDSSAAPYIDSSVQGVFDSATGVYTIDFASASPGKTLTVRHVSKTLFDPDWGNTTFQAAALSFIPPQVQVSQVSTGTQLHFITESGWSYFVDRTESLDPPAWNIVTNFPGTGASVGFIDPVVGPQGFYRVRAVK